MGGDHRRRLSGFSDERTDTTEGRVTTLPDGRVFHISSLASFRPFTDHGAATVPNGPYRAPDPGAA